VYQQLYMADSDTNCHEMVSNCGARGSTMLSKYSRIIHLEVVLATKVVEVSHASALVR
jgi:hypothetical protein